MSYPIRNPSASQRLRHAIVASWRGMPAGPLVDMPTRNVSDVLTGVLKDLGLEERMALEEVTSAWRAAAGEFIAKQAMPETVTRGVLTVRVTQPAVHHALLMEKAALLKRLHERLGHKRIKDVRFRHG